MNLETPSTQDVCDILSCWCKKGSWDQPLRASRWSALNPPHPFPRFPLPEEEK